VHLNIVNSVYVSCGVLWCISLQPDTFPAATKENRGGEEKNPNLSAEVTLVGHSMGTMLLNRLLTLAKPDLPIKRVVYLAPASRIDDFEHYVLPFLATHPSADTWWFSLSRADEAFQA
jgi:pimeloyl-ACP methyl ester carboxylesterase